MSEVADLINAAVDAGEFIAGLFGGSDEPELLPEQIEAARRAAELAAALNPNDPLFQELVGWYELQNRGAMIDALDQMRLQDQEQFERGNVAQPFSVYQPRRDEVRAETLAEGFQNAQLAARQEATNYLLNAVKANTTAAGAFQSPIQTQQLYGALDDARYGNLVASGADLAKTAANTFGSLMSLSGSGSGSYYTTYGNTASKAAPTRYTYG